MRTQSRLRWRKVGNARRSSSWTMVLRIERWRSHSSSHRRMLQLSRKKIRAPLPREMRPTGLSQGDYIQWLDADDLLAADKVWRQMKTLECLGNNRILLSAAWGHFCYRTSAAVFQPTPLWCDLSPVEWFVPTMELQCSHADRDVAC